MTLRSTDGKAPKVARLELHRETLQELTEGEVETVAGGGKKRPHSLADNSCIRMWCRSKLCITGLQSIASHGSRSAERTLPGWKSPCRSAARTWVAAS